MFQGGAATGRLAMIFINWANLVFGCRIHESMTCCECQMALRVHPSVVISYITLMETAVITRYKGI